MISKTLSRGLKSEYAGLCFVMTAAIILRALYLNSPIRYDEAFSYLNFIRRPFHLIITDYAYPNNHVLNSLLSKVSVILLGSSRWTIRLPAYISGVAAIFCSYRLFSKLYDNDIALLIALGLAVSPIMVDMSVNGRGYSMLVLFFLLSVLSMNYHFEFNSLRGLFYSTMLFAMGLYTIPIMIFYAPLLVAMSVCFQSSQGTISRLKTAILVLLGSFIFAGVLYLPLLCNSGLSSFFANSFVQPAPSLSPGIRGFIWLMNYLTISSSRFEELLLIIGIAGSLSGSSYRKKNQILLTAIIITVIVLDTTFGAKLQPRFLYPFTPFILAISYSGLMNIVRLVFRHHGKLIIELLMSAAFVLLLSDKGQCYQSIRDPIDDILPNAQQLSDILSNSSLPRKLIITRDRLHVPLAFELSMIGRNDNIIHTDISEIQPITNEDDFTLLLVSDRKFTEQCLATYQLNCNNINKIECIVNSCFRVRKDQYYVTCSNETRLQTPGLEALMSSCNLRKHMTDH